MGDEKALEASARRRRELISFLKLWAHLAGLPGRVLPERPWLISN